ncbi:MAG: DUF6531 domain-containing protein [Phycisphaerales bacterium]|nr:DUF6531 domain-containing protein [Phycisphaerales bacterium]
MLKWTESLRINLFVVVMVLVGCTSSTGVFASCPDVATATAAGDEIVLKADAGTFKETKEADTPAEGGIWLAESDGGTTYASSQYTLVVQQHRILAYVSQTISSDGVSTVTGDGDIVIPVKIWLAQGESATVHVDVYRSVIPDGNASGTVTFSGYNGQVVSTASGSYTQHETDSIAVPAPPGPGLTLVNVGNITVGSDVSESGGDVSIETEIEISVGECGSDSGGPNADEPPTEDPCGDAGSGGGLPYDEYASLSIQYGRLHARLRNLEIYSAGSSDYHQRRMMLQAQINQTEARLSLLRGARSRGVNAAGDGLFMQQTTGNVWTQIPVLRTYANGVAELDFYLRYESMRGHEDGPLGYGWTHSYNARVEAQPSGEVWYYDANGRRTVYDANLTTPYGRRMDISWVSNHYEISWPDGGKEVFDTQGRLAKIEDRRGRTTRFKYGTNGKLSHIVSPHGRIVTLLYDVNDRLWKITDPDDEFTELIYNGSGELIEITDPLSFDTTFEYQTYNNGTYSIHQMTKETHKNGTYYTAEYGNTAPEKRTIYAHEGMTSHRVVEATAIVGFPDTRLSSMSRGSIEVIDGRGKEWRIFRDSLGRIISTVNIETVADASYERGLVDDARGYLTEVRDREGRVTTATYDQNGFVETRTDAENHVVTFERSNTNFRAFVTKMIEPDNDEWVFAYDNSTGDLLSITDPMVETPTDKKITIQYDTRAANDSVPSAVTAIDAAWTTLPGRVKETRFFDPEGHQIKFEYDASGNLTKVTRGVGALDMVTEYDYDLMGRVKKRTVHRDVNTDVITEWQYDAMGRVTKIIDDPGVGNLALTTDLDYDEDGLLDKLTDPRGTITDFDYDYRDRLIRRVVDSGVGGLALKTEWDPDGNGNVIKRRDPNHFESGAPAHETTFEYNALNYLTRITDSEGYVTEIDRDHAGNATETRREIETVASVTTWHTVKLVYDGIDRVTTRRIDPANLDLTTTVEYTASGGCSCSGSTPGTGAPYKIIDGEGKTTFLHYDELDRLTRIVRKVGAQTGENADSDDAETVLEYDANGNMTKITGPESEVVALEYDEANRRDKLIGDPTGDNIATTLKYDAADNVIEITMPNGNVTDLVYDDVDRLTSATDDLGLITSLTYDENGNVKSRSTAITNQTLQYIYDRANRLKEVRDPIVETPTDKVTTYGYDANGNQTSMVDRLGIETAFKYDKLNRLIEIIEDFQDPPPSPATSTSNTSTHFGYNGVRQTSIKDHDDNETTYDYDEALRRIKATYPDTDGVRKIVEFSYDDAGNLKTRKDQNDITTTYTYNDLHQLTRRAYDTTSRQEDYTWDRSGRLKTADNDTVDIDFTYDQLGRLDLTVQTYADLTAYTTDLDYVVANNDVRRIVTYPNLREVTETRDERFRLESVLNGTTIGANWTYDLGNRRTDAVLGNLLESAFQFDINNRITKINHATDVTDVLTSVFHVNYGYDAVGNRIYADHVSQGVSWAGFDEIYEYDNRHRLINFERGTIDPLSLPDNPSLSSSLNDSEIPSQQSWDTTNGTLDARGNWTALEETINGTTHETEREHTSTNETTRNGGPIAGTVLFGGNRYVHDDAGNLIEVQLLGDMNCDGKISLADNNAFVLALTDPVQYALDYPDCAIEIGDFNGDGSTSNQDISSFTDVLVNHSGDRGILYDYDEENRLTKVSEAGGGATLLEIEYDALGRRVATYDHQPVLDPCGPAPPSTDSIETRHILLGFQTIEEYERGKCSDATFTSWTLVREFLWGERFPEPIAMVDHTAWGDVAAGSEEVLHYVHDALGNVVGLTDAGNPSANPPVEPKLVERYIYDPYGKTYVETWNGSAWTRGPASDFGNPFLWTGQRYDAGVELYHFAFRSYMPKLGRWMQRDPAGYVDGPNLYGYASQNPLFFVDPMGLAGQPPTIGPRNPSQPQFGNPCAAVRDIERLIDSLDKEAERLNGQERYFAGRVDEWRNRIDGQRNIVRFLVGWIEYLMGGPAAWITLGGALDLLELRRWINRIMADPSNAGRYIAGRLDAAVDMLEFMEEQLERDEEEHEQIKQKIYRNGLAKEQAKGDLRRARRQCNEQRQQEHQEQNAHDACGEAHRRAAERGTPVISVY